jgi:hypothetical protein
MQRLLLALSTEGCAVKRQMALNEPHEDNLKRFQILCEIFKIISENAEIGSDEAHKIYDPLHSLIVNASSGMRESGSIPPVFIECMADIYYALSGIMPPNLSKKIYLSDYEFTLLDNEFEKETLPPLGNNIDLRHNRQAKLTQDEYNDNVLPVLSCVVAARIIHTFEHVFHLSADKKGIQIEGTSIIFSVDGFRHALQGDPEYAAIESELIKEAKKYVNLQPLCDAFLTGKGFLIREIFFALQQTYKNSYGENESLGSALTCWHDGRPSCSSFAHIPKALALYFQEHCNVGFLAGTFVPYANGLLMGANDDVRSNNAYSCLAETPNGQMFGRIVQDISYGEKRMTLDIYAEHPDDCLQIIGESFQKNPARSIQYARECIGIHIHATQIMMETCMREMLDFGRKQMAFSGTIGKKEKWPIIFQKNFPNEPKHMDEIRSRMREEDIKHFLVDDTLVPGELLSRTTIEEKDLCAIIDTANHGRDAAANRAREKIDPGEAQAKECWLQLKGSRNVIYEDAQGKRHVLRKNENAEEFSSNTPPPAPSKEFSGSGIDAMQQLTISRGDTVVIYSPAMSVGTDFPLKEEGKAIVICDPNVNETEGMFQALLRLRELLVAPSAKRQSCCTVTPKRFQAKLTHLGGNSMNEELSADVMLQIWEECNITMQEKQAMQEMRSTLDNLIKQSINHVAVHYMGNHEIARDSSKRKEAYDKIAPLYNEFSDDFLKKSPCNPNIYQKEEGSSSKKNILSELEKKMKRVHSWIEGQDSSNDILTEFKKFFDRKCEDLRSLIEATTKDHSIANSEEQKNTDASMEIEVTMEQECEKETAMEKLMRKINLIQAGNVVKHEFPSLKDVACKDYFLSTNSTPSQESQLFKGNQSFNILKDRNAVSFSEAMKEMATSSVVPNGGNVLEGELKRFAHLKFDHVYLSTRLINQHEHVIPIFHKDFESPLAMVVFKNTENEYVAVFVDGREANWIKEQIGNNNLLRGCLFMADGSRVTGDQFIDQPPNIGSFILLLAMWRSNKNCIMPYGEIYAKSVDESGGHLSAYKDFASLHAIRNGRAEIRHFFETDSVFSSGVYFSQEFLDKIKQKSDNRIDTLSLRGSGPSSQMELVKLIAYPDLLAANDLPFGTVMLILSVALNHGIDIGSALNNNAIKERLFDFMGKMSDEASYSPQRLIRLMYFSASEDFNAVASTNGQGGRATLEKRAEVFNKASFSVFKQIGFGENALAQLFADIKLDNEKIQDIPLNSALWDVFSRHASIDNLANLNRNQLKNFLAKENGDDERKKKLMTKLGENAKLLANLLKDNKILSIFLSVNFEKKMEDFPEEILLALFLNKEAIRLLQRWKDQENSLFGKFLDKFKNNNAINSLNVEIKCAFAKDFAKRNLLTAGECGIFIEKGNLQITDVESPLSLFCSFKDGKHSDVDAGELVFLLHCMEGFPNSVNGQFPNELLSFIGKVGAGESPQSDMPERFTRDAAKSFYEKYALWLGNEDRQESKSAFKILCKTESSIVKLAFSIKGFRFLFTKDFAISLARNFLCRIWDPTSKSEYNENHQFYELVNFFHVTFPKSAQAADLSGLELGDAAILALVKIFNLRNTDEISDLELCNLSYHLYDLLQIANIPLNGKAGDDLCGKIKKAKMLINLFGEEKLNVATHFWKEIREDGCPLKVESWLKFSAVLCCKEVAGIKLTSRKVEDFIKNELKGNKGNFPWHRIDGNALEELKRYVCFGAGTFPFIIKQFKSVELGKLSAASFFSQPTKDDIVALQNIQTDVISELVSGCALLEAIFRYGTSQQRKAISLDQLKGIRSNAWHDSNVDLEEFIQFVANEPDKLAVVLRALGGANYVEEMGSYLADLKSQHSFSLESFFQSATSAYACAMAYILIAMKEEDVIKRINDTREKDKNKDDAMVDYSAKTHYNECLSAMKNIFKLQYVNLKKNALYIALKKLPLENDRHPDITQIANKISEHITTESSRYTIIDGIFKYLNSLPQNGDQAKSDNWEKACLWAAKELLAMGNSQRRPFYEGLFAYESLPPNDQRIKPEVITTVLDACPSSKITLQIDTILNKKDVFRTIFKNDSAKKIAKGGHYFGSFLEEVFNKDQNFAIALYEFLKQGDSLSELPLKIRYDQLYSGIFIDMKNTLECCFLWRQKKLIYPSDSIYTKLSKEEERRFSNPNADTLKGILAEFKSIMLDSENGLKVRSYLLSLIQTSDKEIIRHLPCNVIETFSGNTDGEWLCCIVKYGSAEQINAIPLCCSDILPQFKNDLLKRNDHGEITNPLLLLASADNLRNLMLLDAERCREMVGKIASYKSDGKLCKKYESILREKFQQIEGSEFQSIPAHQKLASCLKNYFSPKQTGKFSKDFCAKLQDTSFLSMIDARQIGDNDISLLLKWVIANENSAKKFDDLTEEQAETLLRHASQKENQSNKDQNVFIRSCFLNVTAVHLFKGIFKFNAVEWIKRVNNISLKDENIDNIADGYNSNVIFGIINNSEVLKELPKNAIKEILPKKCGLALLQGIFKNGKTEQIHEIHNHLDGNSQRYSLTMVVSNYRSSDEDDKEWIRNILIRLSDEQIKELLADISRDGTELRNENSEICLIKDEGDGFWDLKHFGVLIAFMRSKEIQYVGNILNKVKNGPVFSLTQLQKSLDYYELLSEERFIKSFLGKPVFEKKSISLVRRILLGILYFCFSLVTLFIYSYPRRMLLLLSFSTQELHAMRSIACGMKIGMEEIVLNTEKNTEKTS